MMIEILDITKQNEKFYFVRVVVGKIRSVPYPLDGKIFNNIGEKFDCSNLLDGVYSDIGHEGPEYHVGLLTYIKAVQLVTNSEVALKMANINISDYREKAVKTDDNRGIWYELGLYTCAFDTLFRFFEMVADYSEAFMKQGVRVSSEDRKLAKKLYSFYVEQFRNLKQNCFKNLTELEQRKYYKFID
jgi:hypothetical protein